MTNETVVFLVITIRHFTGDNQGFGGSTQTSMQAIRTRDASTVLVSTYQSKQHHNPADHNLDSVDFILYKQTTIPTS
jgi:hypothetical protein